MGEAQRICCTYFWLRKVDPWMLAAASAGSSRRTGSVSPQRGHESRRRRRSRIPRPRGLTASDRSTMWSLSPAHAPPTPRPHIPTPGPVERGRENRTEQNAAGMRSGSSPAGNVVPKVTFSSMATVCRGNDSKYQHRGRSETQTGRSLSSPVFLFSLGLWNSGSLPV